MKEMPQITGKWNLMLELRSDSSIPLQKGVFLKDIKLTRTPITRSNEEINPRKIKIIIPKEESTSTCKNIDGLILGTRTKEMVMIILVVIFILTSITLTLKYFQLKDKCRELEDILVSDNAPLPQGRNEALIR